jgi:hypothetical protein
MDDVRSSGVTWAVLCTCIPPVPGRSRGWKTVSTPTQSSHMSQPHGPAWYQRHLGRFAELWSASLSQKVQLTKVKGPGFFSLVFTICMVQGGCPAESRSTSHLPLQGAHKEAEGYISSNLTGHRATQLQGRLGNMVFMCRNHTHLIYHLRKVVRHGTACRIGSRNIGVICKVFPRDSGNDKRWILFWRCDSKGTAPALQTWMWRESMRSLWELDISTAMLNSLQAGMGIAPATEGGEGKMQHSCFS